MSETGGPDWRLLKTRINYFRTRVELAIGNAKDEMEYRSVVSGEEHERASKLAEAFSGETLSFLADNLTVKLKPVNPSENQLRTFQFLMDSVDDGTLLLGKTGGRLGRQGQPMLFKHYEVSTYLEGDSPIHDAVNFLSKNQVNLTVRWGVNEPFPHGLAVWGWRGISSVKSIDFITFPQQPFTAEDAQKTLQIPEKQSGFTQSVNVFNKGQRIIIDRNGLYKGEEVSMTDQYFLVGAFDGQETGRTYWLYGANEEQNRMTVKSKVEARELAYQGSKKR
ncbi:hypothetical protein KKH13_02980 [Patescibacteria group bacterium]|nr:hypothetical protein [Patescibacteria group bacterium]